jgi:hypothetical protein
VKPWPLILLTGAGIFFAWQYTRQSNASRLQYVIKKVSAENGSLSLLVLIGNNSPDDLEQTNLTANILVNGTTVASIADSDPIAIAKGTVTPIAWQLQPSLAVSDKDVQKILTGSSGLSQEIRLSGTVTISGTTLPINLLYKTV